MNAAFNINTEREFLTELELLLDSKGMSYILNSLVNICDQKSQHVNENWQDKKLASEWDRTARKIERAMPQIEAICPSW